MIITEELKIRTLCEEVKTVKEGEEIGAQLLKELAEEYKDKIDIYKVNTETEMETAAAFGNMSLPTLLFIPMSDKPAISPGAPPKEYLKKSDRRKTFG